MSTKKTTRRQPETAGFHFRRKHLADKERASALLDLLTRDEDLSQVSIHFHLPSKVFSSRKNSSIPKRFSTVTLASQDDAAIEAVLLPKREVKGAPLLRYRRRKEVSGKGVAEYIVDMRFVGRPSGKPPKSILRLSKAMGFSEAVLEAILDVPVLLGPGKRWHNFVACTLRLPDEQWKPSQGLSEGYRSAHFETPSGRLELRASSFSGEIAMDGQLVDVGISFSKDLSASWLSARIQLAGAPLDVAVTRCLDYLSALKKCIFNKTLPAEQERPLPSGHRPERQ